MSRPSKKAHGVTRRPWKSHERPEAPEAPAPVEEAALAQESTQRYYISSKRQYSDTERRNFDLGFCKEHADCDMPSSSGRYRVHSNDMVGNEIAGWLRHHKILDKYNNYKLNPGEGTNYCAKYWDEKKRGDRQECWPIDDCYRDNDAIDGKCPSKTLRTRRRRWQEHSNDNRRRTYVLRGCCVYFPKWKRDGECLAEQLKLDTVATEEALQYMDPVIHVCPTRSPTRSPTTPTRNPTRSPTTKHSLKGGSQYSLKGGNQGRWCTDYTSGSNEGVKCVQNWVKQWEKFTIQHVSGDVYGFKSGKTGKWCADEVNRIVCNRDHLLGWERFTLEKHGNNFALKGGNKGRWCADEGNHGIKCNRNWVQAWEKFTISER